MSELKLGDYAIVLRDYPCSALVYKGDIVRICKSVPLGGFTRYFNVLSDRNPKECSVTWGCYDDQLQKITLTPLEEVIYRI